MGDFGHGQDMQDTAAVDPVVVGASSALGGVLLSGVLAYLAERRADGRDARTFERQRVEGLNQERRGMYVSYLRVADSAWECIARLRRQVVEDGHLTDLALVGDEIVVQDALADLEHHRQPLALIADLDTRREAVRFQQTLAALAADVGKEADVLTTLERLYDCMRKSMGIGDFGGVMPLRVTPSRRWHRTARRLGMRFEP